MSSRLPHAGIVLRAPVRPATLSSGCARRGRPVSRTRVLRFPAVRACTPGCSRLHGERTVPLPRYDPRLPRLSQHFRQRSGPRAVSAPVRSRLRSKGFLPVSPTQTLPDAHELNLRGATPRGRSERRTATESDDSGLAEVALERGSRRSSGTRAPPLTGRGVAAETGFELVSNALLKHGEATWLILPVVICLSQRLSHACLSTCRIKAKPRMAH